MESPPSPLLIAASAADARSFAGQEYGAVVVWDLPPDADLETVTPAGSVGASDFGDAAALRSRALDEAGDVAARLVASGWWHVYGTNIARTLRDFIVRELANHLLTILRVEAILDEYSPSEVHVPPPLRPGYYVGDEMLVESVRLVAEKRGIGFRVLQHASRRARAALCGLQWRIGLGLTQNRTLRQASLKSARLDPPRTSGPSDSRGTICVGPCWGAELQSLQPVGDALRERGWRLVFFEIPSYYSRSDWRADVVPEGVTPIGEWGGRRAYVSAVRASEQLRDRLGAPDVPRDAFGILGVNLLDSAYLRARLTRLATADARLAMAMHVCGRRMCEAVEPDLLFSVKAEGPEVRGIMGGAQDVGVPVIFMPHGINADDPRWADVQADLVLPYGDQFADVIARRSSGKTVTEVIGTPKYDAFFREAAKANLGQARAAFGMPPRAVWVGVATTDKSDQDVENVRAASAFAQAHGDAGVLVKTHPRLSQPDLLQRFREAAGPEGMVLSKVDTMRALWCCDVVVTGVSSAAIEALAAGRPVVYVGDPADDIHGYATEGIAVTVPAPTAVGEALSSLLTDPAALQTLTDRGRRFAEYRLGPLDGRATERAVEQIEKLAASARR